MTDTIAHKGRTYTLADPVYSSTIDGDHVAEANLRWVEETFVAYDSRTPPPATKPR